MDATVVYYHKSQVNVVEVISLIFHKCMYRELFVSGPQEVAFIHMEMVFNVSDNGFRKERMK